MFPYASTIAELEAEQAALEAMPEHPLKRAAIMSVAGELGALRTAAQIRKAREAVPALAQVLSAVAVPAVEAVRTLQQTARTVGGLIDAVVGSKR